jgi:hypothetical protein
MGLSERGGQWQGITMRTAKLPKKRCARTEATDEAPVLLCDDWSEAGEYGHGGNGDAWELCKRVSHSL